MLEPTLKPCVQTSCRKGGKDMRIKVSEVMESMETKEAVPQHLQLVPVGRFYQKLQSLLAVPEKLNQKKKKKKKISISVLCSNLTGGCCFQFKCNFPFHGSQVSAVGSPVDIDLSPGSTDAVPTLGTEKLSSRTSCGFSVRKYKRKHTLPEALTQFPLKSMT